MAQTRVKNSKVIEERQRFSVSRHIAVGMAVIVVGTILAYLPAIRAGFIWDDPEHVINNQTLRDVRGLIDMWTNPQSLPQWYPLVHTTFWIEYHLWQLSPIGYHIDNVLLHVTSALLLWRLLTKLGVPGPWLAAAIFAVHPVQVESVAWITERKNVLSGVFYLLSLLAYFRFLDDPKRRGFYLLSLLLFCAALFSKTVVATLPAATLVILWWKRGRIRWTDALPLIPFFILGAMLGLYTAYLETHHVGARSDRIIELRLAPLDRVVLAGRVIWFYAGKLVLPWPLAFIYPQWSRPDAHIWWQWMFPLGVLVAIVILVLNRNRLGRGPATAAMIFCGTLFPALGFFNVYPMRFSYVADHFQYHASAALIALAAAILCRTMRQYGRLVLIPLAALTFLQTPVYAEAETLWRDTLRKNENSWMVHTNLGKVLVTRGEETGNERDLDEAEAHYQRALELNSGIHDTHANMGAALGRRKLYAQALAEFDKALAINPYFAPAYYGMGQVYQLQGDIDRAIENYQKALEHSPNYPEAHYRLALALESKGDLYSAASHYRSAVAGMPENADARYNLGNTLIKLRQFPEAVANLREVVRIRPGWAEGWTNLGAAEMFSGHPQDAIRSFKRALAIKPDLVPARRGLEQATRRRAVVVTPQRAG